VASEVVTDAACWEIAAAATYRSGRTITKPTGWMSNQDFNRPVASPITVTSAASRGSPVGAASHCSWVDGRTLISFTPSRVSVSRESRSKTWRGSLPQTRTAN